MIQSVCWSDLLAQGVWFDWFKQLKNKTRNIKSENVVEVRGVQPVKVG